MKTTQSAAPKNGFAPVLDSQGRSVAGLYRRNSRLYFQKRVNGEKWPRKFPLQATKLKDALAEIINIRADLNRNQIAPKILVPHSSTHLNEKATQLVPLLERWLDMKKSSVTPHTLRCYKEDLIKWQEAFEDFKLRDVRSIDTGVITGIVEKWQKAVGLDGTKTSRLRIRKRLATLRMFLSWVTYLKVIPSIPYDGNFVRNLIPKREPIQARPLLRAEQIEKLADEARSLTESDKGRKRMGPVLADIIELLSCSGLREQEAFTLQWKNVDFEQQELVITKEKCPQNGAYKKVPFNQKLKGVCLRIRAEAQKRGEYQPDAFVFCGKSANRPVRNLRKLLHEAARRAGLENFAFDSRRAEANLVQKPHLGFHDFRRFFITASVNKQIPSNIVAKWVGHKDGGTLIQKTYLKHDEVLSRSLASQLKI